MNSGATTYHPDNIAVNFENFVADSGVTSLQNGDNVLAIHLLNAGLESSDILCGRISLPQLVNLDNARPIEDSVDLEFAASWIYLECNESSILSNNQVKESPNHGNYV